MSDRKYRHRGYQDSGQKDSGRDEPRTSSSLDEVRRSLDGAPKGRSVGTEAASAFKCKNCSQRVLSLDDLGPESACTKCKASLHTCGNCANYNPDVRWECTQPIAARAPKKHSKNDCTFFAPRVVLDLTGKKPESAGDARSAFDRLFDK